MKVTLIQETPDILGTICRIASICYDSDYSDADAEKQARMMNHLHKNGHHSVFEHIVFTFRIEGISRACSHQLVRHRHASYTQRSQRYCTESDTEFVIPVQNYGQEFFEEFNNIMEETLENYAFLIDNKVKPEDARYILPNATQTELYMTLNLRELMHISNERLCMRAQWEIRHLVGLMVSLVDPAVQLMLVPKCRSGYMICNSPCGTQVK